jgi:hypothetical protein
MKSRFHILRLRTSFRKIERGDQLRRAAERALHEEAGENK